jgi:hypothetical protein
MSKPKLFASDTEARPVRPMERGLTMSAADLVRYIHCHRLPLSDEKQAQAELARMLTVDKVEFEREVRLSDHDVIDFMFGDVGLELKLKGQRVAIFRQCERYCEHPTIGSLVLATNAAMGMPEVLNGKPVHVAYLGRAWL